MALGRKLHKRGMSHDKSVKIKRGGEVVEDSYDLFEGGEEEMESIRNPAYVGLQSMLTHNLGDGNFIKVGVSVEIPCRPRRLSVKRATRKAKKFVSARIKSEFKAAFQRSQSL